MRDFSDAQCIIIRSEAIDFRLAHDKSRRRRRSHPVLGKTHRSAATDWRQLRGSRSSQIEDVATRLLTCSCLYALHSHRYCLVVQKKLRTRHDQSRRGRRGHGTTQQSRFRHADDRQAEDDGGSLATHKKVMTLRLSPVANQNTHAHRKRSRARPSSRCDLTGNAPIDTTWRKQDDGEGEQEEWRASTSKNPAPAIAMRTAKRAPFIKEASLKKGRRQLKADRTTRLLTSDTPPRCAQERSNQLRKPTRSLLLVLSELPILKEFRSTSL